MRKYCQNILQVTFLFFIFYSSLIADDNTVSKIEIIGNEHTKDHIILRELTTRIGEPAEQSRIDEDIRRLINLGIFSDVFIEYFEAEDGVTVQVIVIERWAIIPFPSITYDEMDGWGYGGGLFHRNFTGRNRTLGTNMVFGGSANLYIYLYDPWIAGERVSLAIEGSHIARYHPYEDFHQTTHHLWAEVGRRWGYNWWGRVKAGYKRVESDITGITMTTLREDRLPYLKFTAIYNNTDIWVNPEKGISVGSKICQYGIPNDEPDFREFVLSGAKYFPIRFGRTIGMMTAVALRNGSMPHYERYYFGGEDSIRGLEPNSDRGNRLLLTGVEYRADIIKSRKILPNLDFGLGGTIFWDGGMVWTDDFKPETRFLSGFGCGLRFFIPMVEIVRLDAGWTVDSSYRISISTDAKF